MKYILLSSFLIIFSACSSIKPISKKSFERSQSTNVPANVELSLPGETVEETSLFPQVVPTEETVRLGDRGGDVYTPTEEGIETEQTASKKQLRIGLNLGPGLYRAINHVSLLKSLERQNLAPQVITGTGFGAIVAAMYASGMTPEMIEWNFYRYFKEKGNHRPYDTEWLEDVDQLLLEKLKNKNIQDTTKVFYITLYQAKTKKTYYFNKGNLRDLLLQNLKLSNSINQKKKSNQYTAAFENEVFNAGLMKRIGVDFTIAVDVLGNKFDFNDSNEFLIGVYGRTAGLIAREKKGFDFFYSLPLSKMSLDSTENGASFLLKSQEYVEAQTNNLKKLIRQKISSTAKAIE